MDENLHLWKPPFNDDEAILQAKTKVLNRIEKRHKKGMLKTRLKFAAALLAFAGMAGIAYFLNDVEVANTQRELRTVVLPDDSEITLTHGATISYNKIKWWWNKSVVFRGVGHFQIATGGDFVVELPNATIRVLGTAFTVWTNPKNTLIHCTKGKIKVMRDNEEITLEQFEFTTVSKEGIAPKEFYATSQFLRPRNESTLSFTAVPLSIVMKELEIKMNIQISNHLPKGLIYTGTVDTQNVNTCFEVLCKPFGAAFEILPNGDVWIFPQ